MREHMPPVRLRELCHTSRQPQKRAFMVAALRKLESPDVGPHCVSCHKHAEAPAAPAHSPSAVGVVGVAAAID